MEPRGKCPELCGIGKAGGYKYSDIVFSLFVTSVLQILHEWFGRTVICSCAKLSYDHAQSMIDNPGKAFAEGELPAISSRHSVEEVHQAVLNLHRIAKQLRKQRFLDGALRLDQVSDLFGHF